MPPRLGAIFLGRACRCRPDTAAWQAARVATEDPQIALRNPLDRAGRMAAARRDRRRSFRGLALGPDLFVRRKTAIAPPLLVAEIRLNIRHSRSLRFGQAPRKDPPTPRASWRAAGAAPVWAFRLGRAARRSPRDVLDHPERSPAGSCAISVPATPVSSDRRCEGQARIASSRRNRPLCAAADHQQTRVNEVAITVTTEM